MKTTVLLTVLISSIIVTEAQIVNIPDPIFKGKVLADTTINSNGDNEIQVSEASAYTGSIDLDYSGVSDLTGIEAFTGITGLVCRSCQLTSIDVSANTALTLLWVKNNKLTSLDVSANSALINLLCQTNQLTVLNLKNGNNSILVQLNLSGNPDLTCIQVDDTAYANANWSGKKDPTASFSEDCNNTVIGELANGSYFNIIPNPSNGKFQLVTDDLQSAKIKIHNITGEIIYETEKKHPEIDLSFQPKGIYFISVHSEDKFYHKKLIIQ